MSVSSDLRQVKLEGPPEDYSLGDQILPATAELVRERYPQLTDLVDEGSLLVYRRPDNYIERRTDGYRCVHLLRQCH